MQRPCPKLILSRTVAAARRAQMLRGAELSSCAEELERAMGHMDAGALTLADAVLRGVERIVADGEAAQAAARAS